MRFLLLSFLVLTLAALKASAQSKPEFVPDLEKLMAEGDFVQADKMVKQRIKDFTAAKNIDTLRYYVSYLGKTAENLRGVAQAQEEVIALLNQLKKEFPYAKQLVKIYFNGAYFISNTGNHQLALRTAEEIDAYFMNKRAIVFNELPNLFYGMGDFAFRMADNELARLKYLRSLEFLSKIPDPDKAALVKAYHSMAVLSYNHSLYDSSVYYNSKAIAILEETPENIYTFNRLGAIQNHLAGVYTAMGKTKEAKNLYERSIESSRKFLDAPDLPLSVKEPVILSQLYAIGNLGTLYLEINDLAKSFTIYQYYYQQIKNRFANNRFEIGRALLFLAIISNERRQHLQGRNFSLEAIANMRASGNPETGWDADAYAQAAVAFHHLKKLDSATFYYEKANQIQKKINTTSYDKQYFYFQGLLSDFYSATDQPDKAIKVANEGLEYLLKTQGEYSVRTVRMLHSLVVAQYQGKRFSDALRNSGKGLKVLHALLAQTKDPMDSLNIEKELPTYILFKAKASYKLLQKKDLVSIKALLAELEEALKIYERRRTLNTEDGVGWLLGDYRELTHFMKELNYELLKLSSDTRYIDNIISIHESALYTRIRSRLDQQKSLRFVNIPESMQQEELAIKEQMQSAFKGSSPPVKKITAYMHAVDKWNRFQQLVKAKYPAYYQMRYGSTNISGKELGKLIPADITVVRYLFSGEQLFVLVANSSGQTFIPLSADSINEKITGLNTAGAAIDRTTALAYALYQQLWRPLEKRITGSRVVVIPDGILYNLSFEMLTPVEVTSFEALSKNCLLNRYAISYHYSLLAMGAPNRMKKMNKNFVAFTPGFSDETKQQYFSVAGSDSLHLDKNYLSLLPLPFTDQLVSKIKRKFGGTIFAESRSTPDAFRNNSGNNHIIHIGTHAETNNDYPEYSRLIFAKDIKNPLAENAVYLFDIYNYNLAADLAVLTACETGKPGYHDGEGMISMAHAFSYAGSQSIMTGLWKLDEQATAVITEHFYNYLNEGMAKDKALQKAKLNYLQIAKGRMLSPQYWAGLVIMGEPGPVKLQPGNSRWYIGAGLLLLAFSGLYIYFKKKRSAEAAA